MTTAQSWVPNDSATISAPAGGNLAGSVSFSLYASGDCASVATPPSTARPTAGRPGRRPQTVSHVEHHGRQTASGHFSWSVSYDSTNPAQEDIPASCHETSALTVTNGGTVSSP